MCYNVTILKRSGENMKLRYLPCKFGFHKVNGTRVYKEVVKKLSYKGRKPVKKVKWYRVCKICGKKVPFNKFVDNPYVIKYR